MRDEHREYAAHQARLDGKVTPRAGAPERFAHSTLRGMLFDAADLRMMNLPYRLTLTARGGRCSSCATSRALAQTQIEAEEFARHGGVFRPAEEAALLSGRS